MSSILQGVLVGAAVCGAVAFVLWRVVRSWFTTAGRPGCPSCASGNQCADRSDAAPLASDVHPLVLIKTKGLEGNT